MTKISMQLDNPSAFRAKQASLIALYTKSSNDLTRASSQSGVMSFQKPMLARLQGAGKCGGCGK